MYNYSLTEREIYRSLWRIRRPPVRLIVQTALLLLIGVPALVYALLGKGDSGTWLLGIALPILAALIWAIPAVAFGKEARELAGQGTPVCLTVDDTSITVSDRTVPLAEADLRCYKDMCIWRVERGQSVVIPKRVLPDDVWQALKREDV